MDAHEAPPPALRAAWKRCARSSEHPSPEALDPRRPPAEQGLRLAGRLEAGLLAAAAARLGLELAPEERPEERGRIVVHPRMPDLWILPSLLPPAVQTALLERLLHQHLGDPLHATNLDLHYRPAPASPPPAASWFSLAPDGAALVQPKDEAVHKALSPRQVLQRRLHWLTLGGQYDWSERAYPAQAPPPFPPELAAFLQTLFPQTEAQAAIVNLYSPGDSMMMHRDVSEQSDRGLISLSFGCDGLFMVAPDADPDAAPLLFRLRSGDALYMSGQSRYAWHGVPKVLAGTCPDYLDHWPAHEGRFDPWRGWLAGKRVNLNVRQMRNL